MKQLVKNQNVQYNVDYSGVPWKDEFFEVVPGTIRQCNCGQVLKYVEFFVAHRIRNKMLECRIMLVLNQS